MTGLRISPDVELPRDAVTETFAILAKRGAGKSYAASVLVEEMLRAQLQVVVIDPMGAWWGLRSSADGKGPGFPIAILGGDHGDVPLEHTAGELVADLVVDERLSAVLDVSTFSKAERKRFVTDFAERLYRRNREALHLVLEESDLFAPQRAMHGEERMLGAVEDLVRRGRGRGIGITLITQRSAVLNKDVLTQTEVLLALRTTSPHDRKAIEAWIDAHGEKAERDEVMGSLPSLPIGTAWLWSPGFLGLLKRIRIRKRTTFDSSSTPRAGASRATPKTVADVDLGALTQRMAATIERAKAEDPKELRKELAALKRQLAQPAPEPKIERVEVPVLNGQVEDLRRVVDLLVDVCGRLTVVGEDLGGTAQSIARAIDRATEAPRPAAVPVSRPAMRGPKPEPRQSARFHATKHANDDATDDVHLKAGARRILETLARHHPMKVTRAQVGTLSGFKVTGGTFQTYWSVLKRVGYVSEVGGEISVTDAGLAAAGVAVPEPMTTEELLEQWRGALKAGARQMLDLLVDAFPNGLTRDELAEASGFTASGGTFQTYLATLRRNGLIDVDAGEVRATETLFLSGAPA